MEDEYWNRTCQLCMVVKSYEGQLDDNGICSSCNISFDLVPTREIEDESYLVKEEK